MSIKYISKTKDDKWKISVSKTGKAIKILDTQKEAIAYAASLVSTEAVIVKRTSGWQPEIFWSKKANKDKLEDI